MPAVQSSYSATLTPGAPGLVANGEWVTNVISRVLDPAATTAVNFGEAVLQGSNERYVVSANGGTGAFRGVSVRNPTLPPANNDQYLAGNTVAVMTKGVIWVQAAAAVTAGQPAYLTATGGLTNVASGNTALANVIWESTVTAAGPAKLRLG